MPVVYIVCLHAVVYMVLGLFRRVYVYASGAYIVHLHAVVYMVLGLFRRVLCVCLWCV